ncbi:hypothetical protein FRC02_008833 [Tulasnella sp. 418]|nr:hypothetical protein FRC02_008833 [Tulasnella sp. 418]
MAMTPEALIASLQSSLSHHGTLLPQLHAQLGLPSSALTQELVVLQTTLCEVVEEQITKRRNEVDEWMMKCDGIEKECLKLVKCLGSGTKSLASVGELRKITVLPRRHEQLIAHQTKLEQLYNSKHEQLVTVSNRIHNITRTLGPAFFPPDVLNHNPVHASDSSIPIDSSNESNFSETQAPIRVDVTPERFSRLEKELMRGKTEISRRLTQLSSTLENIVWYYAELGIPLPTPEVTSNAMVIDDDSTAVPSTSSSEDVEQNPDRDHNQILARFIARWEEAGDEALEGDTLGVEGVDPTVEVMEWAENLKSEVCPEYCLLGYKLTHVTSGYQLEEIKSHREARIQAIFDQLEGLWKRLGVEDDQINEFIESNRGSTEENVQAICEEERQLAESAADQSRLLGRGPRGDPGRLLREEKMRKRVKKEKPRLENDLLQSIPAWETQYGRQFLINGVRVVDVLMESVEAEASKENTHRRKQTRQASATIPARATTPVPQNTSRKHAATPTRSVSQTVPSKRQRLNTGTSTSSASSNRPPSTTPSFGMSTSSNRSAPTPVPLGVSRTANKGKTASHQPSVSKAGTKSSVPCTPSGEFTFRMPPPSSLKQQANLGLGLPSSTRSGRAFSNSSSTSSSAVKLLPGAPARMVAVKKRESFRPRPSTDGGVFGMGGLKNYGRLIAAPGGRPLIEETEDIL